jgi:NADH:ubiquinone oxidoreductase subunit 6 (subunit J)
MSAQELPLGLPRGSVRAILAIGIVGSAIFGVFMLPVETAGLLLALAGVVVSSYFKDRAVEESDN